MVWLFAVLCASLGWSALVLGFGTTHPLEVVSGHSMLPTLRTGDVVVIAAVPPWALRVGEIVAVRVPIADQRTYHYPAEIVHRISALYVQGNRLIVQTKGDNQGPDPFTVPASAISGRMLFAVPWIGYGFLFLRSRPGHVALIGLAALVVLYLGALALLQQPEPLPVPQEQPVLGVETSNLALAIREYGEHLRSHTLVVRELGATTGALRQAAQSQNAILGELRGVLSAAAATQTGFAETAARSERAPTVSPEVSGSRSAQATRVRGRHRRGFHRRRTAVAPPVPPQMPGDGLYASRRARKQHQRV